MCWCQPNVRTPNCGSQKCLELCQKKHPEQNSCRWCRNWRDASSKVIMMNSVSSASASASDSASDSEDDVKVVPAEPVVVKSS